MAGSLGNASIWWMHLKRHWARPEPLRHRRAEIGPALIMTSKQEIPPDAYSGGQCGGPLRSFGRRRGRKLSPRQASLLTSGLERLRLDLGQPASEGGLAALFAGAIEETWLEIGFGGGEHLIWQAEHNPHAGIIGAEPYVNGVVAALSAIEAPAASGPRASSWRRRSPAARMASAREPVARLHALPRPLAEKAPPRAPAVRAAMLDNGAPAPAGR